MTSVRVRSAWWVYVTVGLLALGAAFFGCAKGGAEFNDDDDGAGGAGGSSVCGMDCSQIQTDACHVGICDTETLKCAVVAADNGTSCDDGQFCTAVDTCVDGYCTGTGTNDCGQNPTPCQDVVCNEVAKSCSLYPKAEGASCEPDDLCQINGVCTSGACLGEARNCMYAPVPSDCYVAVCNPANGNCEAEIGNEGGDCDDPNDPCQVSGTCNNGTCEDTSLKDCSSESDPANCKVGVCNPTTGICQADAVGENEDCDDLDACTVDEACHSGTCNGGTALGCGPDDGCCPASGCTPAQDPDCRGHECAYPRDVTGKTFPFHMYGTYTNDPSASGSCVSDSTFHNAVWFSYTPATTTSRTVSLTNASTTYAYSRMAIFEGTGCAPYGTQVACKTNSAKDVSTSATLNAGTTYLILFHTDGESWTMVDPTITISPP